MKKNSNFKFRLVQGRRLLKVDHLEDWKGVLSVVAFVDDHRQHFSFGQIEVFVDGFWMNLYQACQKHLIVVNDDQTHFLKESKCQDLLQRISPVALSA